MYRDLNTKLSKKEAFAIIGLHQKDDKTYFLANMILLIDKNELSITTISGNNVNGPQDTIYTKEPFIFTHHGINYTLKVESNNLNVYKKEQLIGN